jgi:hypothetical protein
MRRYDINLQFLTSPSTQLVFTHFVLSTIANEFNSDINALILDYLTMEGYPNAAANFSKEANLVPHQETPSIIARQEIQNCIHSGNIQTAIETLNDFDPEVRTFSSTSHSFLHD